MAERIEVELVDDIDGSPAQHTITFALDGVHYEIDLNKQHAKQLRSTFAPYVEKARTPEKADKPRTGKQREREERRQRQENKQLTEQIRGAAQRTREQQKAQEGREKAARTDEPSPEPTEQPAALGDQVQSFDSQRTEPAAAEQRTTSPAVPVPQFSSAVD
jgi:hypothetical protein